VHTPFVLQAPAYLKATGKEKRGMPRGISVTPVAVAGTPEKPFKPGGQPIVVVLVNVSFFHGDLPHARRMKAQATLHQSFGSIDDRP
jgi:hypothetical protein